MPPPSSTTYIRPILLLYTMSINWSARSSSLRLHNCRAMSNKNRVGICIETGLKIKNKIDGGADETRLYIHIEDERPRAIITLPSCSPTRD